MSAVLVLRGLYVPGMLGVGACFAFTPDLVLRIFHWILFPNQSFRLESPNFLAQAWGVMGIATIAWAVSLNELCRLVLVKRTLSGWNHAALSVTAWFVIDSLASFWYEVPRNVYVNCAFYVVFLIPMIFLRLNLNEERRQSSLRPVPKGLAKYALALRFFNMVCSMVGLVLVFFPETCLKLGAYMHLEDSTIKIHDPKYHEFLHADLGGVVVGFSLILRGLERELFSKGDFNGLVAVWTSTTAWFASHTAYAALVRSRNLAVLGMVAYVPYGFLMWSAYGLF